MHRAVIELMEPRQHLAATAGLVDGTLVVIGTERRDEIVANLLAERGRRTYSVTVNGYVLWTKTTRGDETMPPLLVEGRGGTDEIDVRSWQALATLFGGAGNDRITVGGQSTVLGGAGNDTLTCANGMPSYFDGGRGDDVITFGYRSVVHGGSGNDRAISTSAWDEGVRFMFGSGVEDVVGETQILTRALGGPSREPTYDFFNSAQWRPRRDGTFELVVRMRTDGPFTVTQQLVAPEGSTPSYNVELTPGTTAGWPTYDERTVTTPFQFAFGGTFEITRGGQRSGEVSFNDLRGAVGPFTFVDAPTTLAPRAGLSNDVLRVVVPLSNSGVEAGLGSVWRDGDRLIVPVLYKDASGALPIERVPATFTLDLQRQLAGVRQIVLANASGQPIVTIARRAGPR